MGKKYTDLLVWQEAMTLVESVYSLTRGFPKEELYGLVSQMRRAGVSIPSNIAEGQARKTRGEFIQFLGQARGSLAELGTQLILSKRLQMSSPEAVTEVGAQINKVGKVLNALISRLKKDASALK